MVTMTSVGNMDNGQEKKVVALTLFEQLQSLINELSASMSSKKQTDVNVEDAQKQVESIESQLVIAQASKSDADASNSGARDVVVAKISSIVDILNEIKTTI